MINHLNITNTHKCRLAILLQFDFGAHLLVLNLSYSQCVTRFSARDMSYVNLKALHMRNQRRLMCIRLDQSYNTLGYRPAHANVLYLVHYTSTLTPNIVLRQCSQTRQVCTSNDSSVISKVKLFCTSFRSNGREALLSTVTLNSVKTSKIRTSSDIINLKENSQVCVCVAAHVCNHKQSSKTSSEQRQHTDYVVTQSCMIHLIPQVQYMRRNTSFFYTQFSSQGALKPHKPRVYINPLSHSNQSCML